jgi:hypothetical protein
MKLTKKQREIVARTVLGEVGTAATPEEMQSIAWVVRNRTESGRYPSDPAAVVLQKHQFPGVHNSVARNATPRQISKALTEIDKVFGGEVSDNTGGAIGYYANKGPNAIGEPSWFKKVGTGATQVGPHIFASTRSTKSFPTDVTLAHRETTFKHNYFTKLALLKQNVYAMRTGQETTGQVSGIRVTQINPDGTDVQTGVDALRRPSELKTRKVHTIHIDPTTGEPQVLGHIDGFDVPSVGEARSESRSRRQPWGDPVQQRTIDIMGSHYQPPATPVEPPDRRFTLTPTPDRADSTRAGHPADFNELSSWLNGTAHPHATGTIIADKNQDRIPSQPYLKGLGPKWITTFKTKTIQVPLPHAPGYDTKEGHGAVLPDQPTYKTVTVQTPVRILVQSPQSEYSYNIRPYVPPPPTVRISSGRDVPVGTTGTAQGGRYHYQVQSDGSVRNTDTGRTTARAPGSRSENAHDLFFSSGFD